MGGLAGHWHVYYGAHDQRRDKGRGTLLYWQPEEKRPLLRNRVSETLGDRKQLALANGCQLWRRRQPDCRAYGGGEPRLGPPSSSDARQTRPPERGYQMQATSGGLGP